MENFIKIGQTSAMIS